MTTSQPKLTPIIMVEMPDDSEAVRAMIRANNELVPKLDKALNQQRNAVFWLCAFACFLGLVAGVALGLVAG